MSKLKDLTGQKFGRLTVIERAENSNGGKVRWLCKCDCGNEKIVQAWHLNSGSIKSCGCLAKEGLHTTHGMTGTPIYDIWHSLLARCRNLNNKNYKNYGGRGINVCDEWLDFQNFYDCVSKLEHFGEEGYSLDRIDNNGNYEPNNVRWAKNSTQSRNTRRNVFVDYNGQTLILKDAAKESDIPYLVLWNRFKKGDRGDRLFRPVRKKK